jgi:hypothetical protein
MKPDISTERTPLSWLWEQIERRFGKEAAHDLYTGYLAELRRYQLAYRARHSKKRERERP